MPTLFELFCGLVVLLCGILVYIGFADKGFCKECQMYHDDIPD